MKKKLSIKNWLSNVIAESEMVNEVTPKFTSDNVDFVSNIQINPTRGIIVINFVTKDEKSATLKAKDTNFYKWIKTNQSGEENIPLEFVKFFLDNHTSTEKIMSEIVDEYNGLIGDEDLPKDSNRMIGLSSKDSTQATYQTRAKGWNNFNTGAISGFISW
jgi:hypothetical protein